MRHPLHFVRFAAAAALLAVAAFAAEAIKPGTDPFASKPPFLAVDEAFVFSARLREGRLIGRWQMPDGYYLYRQRFRIEPGPGVQLGELEMPAGKQVMDDHFGASEVYYGSVEISAPVLSHAALEISARFRYQGCADYGLCYPLQTRSVRFAAAQDASLGPRVETASKASPPPEALVDVP